MSDSYEKGCSEYREFYGSAMLLALVGWTSARLQDAAEKHMSIGIFSLGTLWTIGPK
jgi:hypothetical protein